MNQTQSESLDRAVTGQSMANYPAIIMGFSAKGIPEGDIIPRENVFTFQAWRAKGRSVRKGEHGIKIVTYIPIPEKTDSDGKVTRVAGRRPKSTTVFHVSQTD